MAETIKVTYEGIEIEYHEDANRWRFELRGRERFADSLAKAKEAIDKPAPQCKTKFERVKAYKRTSRMFDGGTDGYSVVEITSLAERGYGQQQVWISNGKDRRKEPLTILYAITPENDALIADILALEKQIESLREQREKKQSALSHPVVNADE